MAVQQLTILGATGSIGLSTLDVVSRHPDQFQVFALSAHTNVDKLAELCSQFQPKVAVVADVDGQKRLLSILAEQNISDIEVLYGHDALCAIASHSDVDIVMAAIVGAAGLLPNLAAANAGKRVLLANKESLVMSGELFMAAVKESGSVLLPIDSEHNAIFQCLPHSLNSAKAAADIQLSSNHLGIHQILLTASGGPFRKFSYSQLEKVTPAQAVAHPNWSMGQKISVDSATLMNKGLEFIEACWLFGCKADDIQVVVHPESVIHSMVSYTDGSVIAQLGNPDMRTPIAYGMAWPERIDSGVKPLNLFEVAQLNFEAPDLERFPCLALAKQAFVAGGAAPAILNAANEVAVDAFLNERIAFTDIPKIVDGTLQKLGSQRADGIDAVLSADQSARKIAQSFI
jgi:1-deoxy-D-xylulose-5-phosphate reductoisomerase